MNYEEIKEKYENVIYEEDKLIGAFLSDVADIRYGTQMYEWHLSPMPELKLFDGKTVQIHHIGFSKCYSVILFGFDGNKYESYDFCYGELKKVIEQLPDVEGLKRNNALNDLKEITSECSIVFEDDEKFTWTEDSVKYTICDIMNDGELSFDISVKDKTESFGIWKKLPNDVITKFAEHSKKVVLHRSREYKKLMELLALEENLRFVLGEKGKSESSRVHVDGTDCDLRVTSAYRDDIGNLTIHGGLWYEGTELETITLTEKDIKPEYLMCIIKAIEEENKPDIMDEYNGHNKELVDKINDAWKKDKERFRPILRALYTRDDGEFEDKFDFTIKDEADILEFAHEIMEGVCDDWDLETILSFLRIK